MTEDTSNLQTAESTLASDTEWCNDPLDGGFTGTVRDFPCSTAIEDDNQAIMQATQTLSYAEATLDTLQQELTALPTGP